MIMNMADISNSNGFHSERKRLSVSTVNYSNFYCSLRDSEIMLASL
jgi:hypothetical protein